MPTGNTETLADIAVEMGVDMSKIDRDLDTVVNKSLRAGERAGEGFGSRFAMGFSSPLLNAIGGLNQLLGGARTLANFGMTISGVGIAGTMEKQRRSIQGVIGDLRLARAAYADLLAVDARSPFKLGTIERAAKPLLASGVSGNQIGSYEQAISDAVAGTGGDDAAVDGVSKALAKMRQSRSVSAKQISRFATMYGLPIDRLASDALHRPVASGQGAASLARMDGRKVVEMLIEGMKKEFAGAAEAAASGTLEGLGASLQKDVQLMMEPTGNLIAGPLKAIGGSALTAATWLTKMNAATGGGAGLAGIVAVGLPILVRFGFGLVSARQKVTELSTAIENLANLKSPLMGSGGSGSAIINSATITTAYVNQLFAASSMGGGGYGGGAGSALVPYAGAGAGAAVSGGAAAAEGVAAAGGAAALGTGAKLLGAVKAGAGSIVSLLPFAATLGIGYAADQQRQAGHTQRADALSKIGQGVGTGSLIGSIVGGAIGAGIGFFAGGGPATAAAGGFIGSRWGGLAGAAIGGGGAALMGKGKVNAGGLWGAAGLGLVSGAGFGAAIGGLPGAVVGGLIGAAIAPIASYIIQSRHNKPEKGTDDATKKQVDALERNTDALNKMAFRTMGGGERARSTATSLEGQYAMLRYYA